MGWFSNEKDAGNFDSIWESIRTTLYTTKGYLLHDYNASAGTSLWDSIYWFMSNAFAYLRHVFSVIMAYLIELCYASFLFLLACIAVLLMIIVLGLYFKKKRNSSTRSGFRFNLFRSRSKSKENMGKDVHYGLKRVLVILVLSACVLSIPWEFVRQYHLQNAKQAAITLKGLPPECDPATMTYVTSARHWVRSLFSWSQDPCIEYHQALLVHPLAEISPLAVVSGALTRFVVQPVLVLSETLPIALRNIFSELPLHWQPFFFLLLVIVIILFFLTTCRYKICLPFVSIEPASPPAYKDYRNGKGDGKHVNRKNNKLAIQDSSFNGSPAANGWDNSLDSLDSSAVSSDDSSLDPSYKPSSEVKVKPRSGLTRFKQMFTSKT